MDPHEEFFRSLSREEVQLLALREYLYEGSWAEIVADLEARKHDRPYVFKLDSRIDEDLDRIRRLADYELTTGADLGSYLHLVEEAEGEK
jgi:hypothetical protein